MAKRNKELSCSTKRMKSLSSTGLCYISQSDNKLVIVLFCVLGSINGASEQTSGIIVVESSKLAIRAM